MCHVFAGQNPAGFAAVSRSVRIGARPDAREVAALREIQAA